MKRVFGFLSWFAPSALLALLPKCPMCLAAWIGVTTGIGLSMTAAAYVRGALVIASVVALLLFVAGRLRRIRTRRLSV